MRVYQNVDGGTFASAREYDIAANTKIYAGQLVDLTGGLVTAHAAAGTGAVLGVAAEYHSGAPDMLDPRADGVKIRVYDAPHQVFACPAPVVTASGGSATTVKAAAAGAASAYVGGWLKLRSKAAGSTNTDTVGTMRRITAFATTDGGTFTVEEGGVPAAGDEYILFPPVGFAGGNLDEEGGAIVLTATAAIPLRVIGRIETTNEIAVIPTKHVLGVN